ncbi:MAG: bifunctional demethylmenaquinone methyltransferase/2-methoxy-6-polyprenyl-1,4-benzoquinol methylase UbiE [Gammaproteobacteria bacterium]|jgi:demethylmenaquinone methyltransferase/2-methoxy-6-polyprenyl-1,4-benzoquinol methylase
MSQFDKTDFGYQKISPQEKRERISKLFDSVASKYDLMNDLMSLGMHRIWKHYAVNVSGLREGDNVLDVAGGTGDLAKLFARRVRHAGNVVICDISHDMLCSGRDKMIDQGLLGNLKFIQGDAENLPFKDNSFDLVCIAFGLRNITDKKKALRSFYAKLKYGKPLIILEFSKVRISMLRKIYDNYSKHCIPFLGKFIANDEESYRYLIESIQMHPDQEALKTIIEDAGFSKVKYQNLSGGVVAIHSAYKI